MFKINRIKDMTIKVIHNCGFVKEMLPYGSLYPSDVIVKKIIAVIISAMKKKWNIFSIIEIIKFFSGIVIVDRWITSKYFVSILGTR
ncbi:MAG: hypothetical protein K2I49_01765 [Ureaplasma sp.]|nr:hypothetical protein [Ureaplasma sp.]